VTTGTLTFLFSDIEGSTRLLDELGSSAYTAVLERQASILRGAFAAHGGREENTEGDSFFVLFDSAQEAVLAAIDGQRLLATEAWPDGIEIRVRMGLHAGEATTSAAGSSASTSTGRPASPPRRTAARSSSPRRSARSRRRTSTGRSRSAGSATTA
jgi:class 3 adenylate cyclase